MVAISFVCLALSTLLTHFRAFRKVSSSTSPTLLFSSAGPRGEGKRRLPRSASDPQREFTRRRSPPTKHAAFDGKELTHQQSSNHNAIPIDLSACSLTCVGTSPALSDTEIVPQPAFRFMSLDDIFPGLGFSDSFNSRSDFRFAIRDSMRLDIFDATPQYQGLTEKAKSMLILPESSLQGSWRTPGVDRMGRLTKVLKDGLGSNAPSGDELMHTIGLLCGSNPSTHWIDIVGVLDRKISHSWHQDAGRSPGDSRTVLWGFSSEDNYEGTGVFSHVLPILRECIAPDDHPRMEPVLFQGTVSDEYIVKPSYGKGRELLLYRDIDVLHSSPDVAYRTSVMRFM